MLKQLIEQFIGTYIPKTYTDYVYDAAQQTFVQIEHIANGVAGIDWAWVIAASCFVIVLYSVFRLLGVFLRDR